MPSAKEYRRFLINLSAATDQAIMLIDQAMKGPSTLDRGKTIARIMNALQLENDIVKRFALARSKPKP
ncbi:MAG: hypothetical protein KGL39_03840 [Patescibacteria group bacterium]|nr:hypothetical protein [Patescibacteria group bacterium]